MSLVLEFLVACSERVEGDSLGEEGFSAASDEIVQGRHAKCWNPCYLNISG